ncbi:ribosome rescue GTPase HflX [Candidatus Spongiihabitans sp.]|uniref:ribosome rescue GTPase HflX n=1 Tax=Candidatus Spongiihabitans sp. TaxID=3101308 RepID=UPI003C6F6329
MAAAHDSVHDPGPLRELSDLAISAGADVCGVFIAVRAKPVAATFMGKGKAEELGEMAANYHATVVIFDHAISPVQERNIERIVQCRVLDRSGLILDIFAQRATSSEGKLQVELAQLKHLSTRLVRGWTHLERQKGGIGLRGPGESQLETDRRLIGARIKTLTGRLGKVEAQRSLRRRARHRTPIPTVSLVGYTNAGKSSLFNAITGSDVRVENNLFTTLDATMRRVELPGFGPIVLSDTVGFVRQLPHTLVAAFHSTLEEVASATCLLLVSDVSDPDHLELGCHVQQVLDEIGAKGIPVIHVNNKIDLTGDTVKTIQYNGQQRVDKIWLSAETGAGVEFVQQALAALLSQEHRYYLINLKPQAGALRSKLFTRCEVINEEVDESGAITMKVKMQPAVRGWLESQRQYDGLWDQIADAETDAAIEGMTDGMTIK